MSDRKDILRGTLDLTILRIISNGPIHGLGVMQRLRHLTDDTFQVTPGSLFPALRLEENGWASGHWDRSENNRYCSITKAGGKQLASETDFTEELCSFVEHDTESRIRSGMSPEDAHRAALIELGAPNKSRNVSGKIGQEPVGKASFGTPVTPCGVSARRGDSRAR